MVIECFRCGKAIERANERNADYIVGNDTVVDEPREVIVALKHNVNTLKKLKNKQPIADEEYDVVEVSSFEQAYSLDNVVRAETRKVAKPTQKTAIICPDCYKPTDFVIWGVHKNQSGGK